MLGNHAILLKKLFWLISRRKKQKHKHAILLNLVDEPVSS